MSETRQWNLDDESERDEFIARYGTGNGRWLAKRLSLAGKRSATIATALSNYAWNARTAAQMRKRGDIETALVYERIAENIYTRDLSRLGWW